jgi:nucleotide-binding universal stress UspA family protein
MTNTALVAADFSGESEAARHRTARIAGETGMTGTILHVLPASLPADLHLQAATQAQKALAVVADEMKRE